LIIPFLAVDASVASVVAAVVVDETAFVVVLLLLVVVSLKSMLLSLIPWWISFRNCESGIFSTSFLSAAASAIECGEDDFSVSATSEDGIDMASWDE
jgi:hypothetical protein